MNWWARFYVVAVVAMLIFVLVRGEDTRSDAGKTQRGVERTTRTIVKTKKNAAEIRRLTRQLDGQLKLANQRFAQLLELLTELGIDTSTIDRGGRIDSEVPQSQPAPGPGPPPAPSGGSPGVGGDVGGGPPSPQPPPDPKPPSGGNPDPPKPPPPGPVPKPSDPPSLGGTGIDAPILGECDLAPVLCS